MLVRYLRRTAQVALSALTLSSLAAGTALAGPPCKAPCGTPYPPSAVQPGTTPGMPPVTPPITPPVEPPTGEPVPEAAPSLGDVAPGAVGSDVVARAPNVLGNLLGAGKSISFFVQRSSGSGFLFNTGTTNIINSKIADNNSPLPQDRLGFRFNYFDNGVSVKGLADEGPFADPIILLREFSDTRQYDVKQYTFDFEKTILNGMASVQLRVPFSSTLAASNILNYGTVTGEVTLPRVDPPPDFSTVLTTQRTPNDTYGRADTQFGDVDVALKALLWSNERFYVSGGLSVHVPTAPDTRLVVNDFSGNLLLVTGAGGESIGSDFQRRREFLVKNQTWAASPFLAFLALPSERMFAQGFAQVELPLNSSDVTFNETLPVIATGRDPAESGIINPLPNEQRTINEQTLLHLSTSFGYWLTRNPDARFITGIAPSVELHYTTALDDADLVQLSSDGSVFVPEGTRSFAASPGPIVGNQRNRLDILDLTLATTFELGNRATLATGLTLPLRGEDNRTFDYEVQVQFNWYFGCSSQRSAPNFQ